MILGTSMSVAAEISTLSDVDSNLEWVVTYKRGIKCITDPSLEKTCLCKC